LVVIVCATSTTVHAGVMDLPKTSFKDSDKGERALIAELERLSISAQGEVGVAVRPLGAANPVSMNGGHRFPMASTFKIAVAATILSQIDGGTLTLDQMVSVNADSYVESEVIASSLIHPGVALSVYNLLELMLTQSDNTAADSLVALAGGTAAVTGWLRHHGIRDQEIDRNTAELIRDFLHLAPGPTSGALADAVKGDPVFLSKHVGIADAAFDADPRDRTTPLAMVNLLTALFNGDLLSSTSTRTLVDIMARCRT
jgi:beta-lactamase class A